MGSMSIWHWMIVLLIVALVFGTKKLRNIGADLGGAVKGFKEGMSDGQKVDDESVQPRAEVRPEPLSNSGTIDVEAKEKTRN